LLTSAVNETVRAGGIRQRVAATILQKPVKRRRTA